MLRAQSNPGSARPARKQCGAPSRMISGMPCRNSRLTCSESSEVWLVGRNMLSRLPKTVSQYSKRCSVVAGMAALRLNTLEPKGVMDRVPAG